MNLMKLSELWPTILHEIIRILMNNLKFTPMLAISKQERLPDIKTNQ